MTLYKAACLECKPIINSKNESISSIRFANLTHPSVGVEIGNCPDYKG